MKILVFCLLALSVMAFVAFQLWISPGPNLLRTTSTGGEIKTLFGASSTDPKDRYAALLVPIRFDGLERDFYLQVDTGHPNTKFYKTKLESIRQKQYEFGIQQSGLEAEQAIAFQMGGENWILEKTIVRKDRAAPIDWDKPDQAEVVGTLGADAWENKVVEFDYPQKVIRWGDAVVTKDIPDAIWQPIRYRFRRTLLRSIIEGKETWLMYDTGSSAYRLITDEKTFARLRVKDGEIEKTKGNSWGKQIDIQSCDTEAVVEIGGKILQLTKVTHMSGMGKLAEGVVSLTGLQGMTGNTLFLNERLVLDYQSKRFLLRNHSSQDTSE